MEFLGVKINLSGLTPTILGETERVQMNQTQRKNK
jgi:hypothetical protein